MSDDGRDEQVISIFSTDTDLEYPCGDIWEPVPGLSCVHCNAHGRLNGLEQLMRHHGDGTSVGPLERRCTNCRVLYTVYD